MDSEETKRSDKLGLSPGTLMHVGEKKTDKTRITVIDYDAVRERIRGGKGRIRKLGPDYLAYALIIGSVAGMFAFFRKKKWL